MILDAVVSYRSVPRLLKLFHTKTDINIHWIPHFTSVINWTLRLGLGLLTQVTPIREQWAAIVDHSIDIGTKKALVVLRIPLDVLTKRQTALTLADCECIGLKVSEKVNGESIADDLNAIFAQAGDPSVIIKDCDRTLQKGVRLCAQKRSTEYPVIDDIGHVVARALKAEYEQSTAYKQFTSLTAKGAKRLRQTRLASLVPPKLRSKGRFQSIGKLGQWGKKMLNILDFSGPPEKGSALEKLRQVFAELSVVEPFIHDFANTAKITSKLMKILKNKGLDLTSYQQCQHLIEKLDKPSKVKTHLQDWLQKHKKIQQQFPLTSLPVSSDIIESLFGHFKHIIERSPQADMNRTTLLIPALCGNHNEAIVLQALKHTRQHDLNNWDKENIPYTVRKERYQLLNNIQKTGELLVR